MFTLPAEHRLNTPAQYWGRAASVRFGRCEDGQWILTSCHKASGGWGARNTAWPEWQGACRPYYHVTNAGPAPLSISAAIFPGSPGRAFRGGRVFLKTFDEHKLSTFYSSKNYKSTQLVPSRGSFVRTNSTKSGLRRARTGYDGLVLKLPAWYSTYDGLVL